MKRTQLLSTSVVSCLALAGCASTGEIPAEGRLKSSPAISNGFAPNTQVETIVARARYVEDQDQMFGDDMLDEYGVIPIAIKLGLKGVGSEHETVYANPQQMDFRLYLEDGTALQSIAPAKVAGKDSELEAKLSKLALREDDLPNFNNATDKFVFFRLTPRDAFETAGNRLLHQAGHVQRTLALDRSLLSFKINRLGKTLPFYIGISRVQRPTD